MEVNLSQARLFSLLHHGDTMEDLAWCSQPATGLQLCCLQKFQLVLYKFHSELPFKWLSWLGQFTVLCKPLFPCTEQSNATQGAFLPPRELQ